MTKTTVSAADRSGAARRASQGRRGGEVGAGSARQTCVRAYEKSIRHVNNEQRRTLAAQ